MNNKELMEFFEQIAQNSNCFDRELMLRKANKEYKKSEFFKKTWMPIGKAFMLYQANAFNSLGRLINNTAVSALLSGDTFVMRTALEKFFAEFDTSSLDGIAEYLINQFESLSLDSASSINTLSLLIKELQKIAH